MRPLRLGTGVSLPVPLFGQRATAVGAARPIRTRPGSRSRCFARTRAGTRRWRGWTSRRQERARLLGAASADAARVASIADEKFKAGPRRGSTSCAPRLNRERARADAALAHCGRTGGGGASQSARRRGCRRGEWAAAGQRELTLADVDLGALQSGVGEHPSLRRDRARIARRRHTCAQSSARAGRSSPLTSP